MEYYKYERRCAVCQVVYGLDYEDDNNLCPICEAKMRHRGSILNHTKKIETV